MTETTSPPPPEPVKKRRRGRGVVLSLLLLLLIGAGLAAGGVWWGLQKVVAPGPLVEERVVLIPSGTGLRGIAAILKDAGAIEREELFLLAARLDDRHRRLKAGEYALAPGISILGILDQLERHDVLERFLTVPEGRTSVEILAILEAAEGLEGEVGDPPPEGSLLPETYAYLYGDSRAGLLDRMRRAMKRLLAEAWEARQPGLPLNTPEEAVILASIVEKETGVAAERPMVAGVFVNRLRRGMRLQSDPTVIFALTEGKAPLGRALTRADWQVDSPYNTYRIAALPPGPIAHPGLEAIKAVLNPAETKALYFVADGTGGHVFAETLEEHNRNVRAWRRVRDGSGN